MAWRAKSGCEEHHHAAVKRIANPCQLNHLHHSSSPTMPPLLRLLPTPAGARFYSPSRLATSLVTPTSRRPINRHGLLSRRTYIPQQASHIKPKIEEIKEWNEDELLKWIQQKRPGLLRKIAVRETAGRKSKLLSFIPCTPRRQQANNVT